MAIDQRLYGALAELTAALREDDVPTTPLPQRDAMHWQFAVWFALQAYYFALLMASDAPEERKRISPRVAERAASVGKALGGVVGRDVPGPPPRSFFSVMSSLFSVGGAAVGGYNWCRHGDEDVPMEIIRNHPRNPASELEMTCSHAHTTEYDVDVARGNVLHKV